MEKANIGNISPENPTTTPLLTEKEKKELKLFLVDVDEQINALKRMIDNIINDPNEEEETLQTLHETAMEINQKIHKGIATFPEKKETQEQNLGELYPLMGQLRNQISESMLNKDSVKQAPAQECR